MGFPTFNDPFCTLEQLKHAQPWRFWCYKVMPLTFDDSLSYYENVCKYMDWITKAAEDIKTLDNQMQCLTDFLDDMKTHLNDLIEDYNDSITRLDAKDTELENRIDSLGTVLEYKGSVANIINLPEIGNKVGDVWYVESEQSAFAWVIDTEHPHGHWEEFGPPINLEPYLKKDGSEPMTGDLNMDGHKVTSMATPATDTDGANKKYVDDQIADIPQPDMSEYLKRDGSLPMTGTLAFEERKTTLHNPYISFGDYNESIYTQNMPEASTYTLRLEAGRDDVQRSMIDISNNGITLTPNSGFIFANGQIKNVTTPTHNKDAANKQYVDEHSGAQPITVTKDSAYISTPSNNFTTKTLADPTAPPTSPIQKDQIAVYSETNQTYAEDDVQATLLVADPHSAMEAVNKRTLDGYLSKANIDDTFKRVTAVSGRNPGTEDYIIVTVPTASTDKLNYANKIIMTDDSSIFRVWDLIVKNEFSSKIITAEQFKIPNMYNGGFDFQRIQYTTGDLINTVYPTITITPYNSVDTTPINNIFKINIAGKISTILLGRVSSQSSPETIIIDATDITFKVKEPVNNEDAVSKNYADTHMMGISMPPLPTTPETGDYILNWNGTQWGWRHDIPS